MPRAGRTTAAAVYLLLAVTLAVGFTALKNPFILDDGSKIVNNTDIRRLADLPRTLVYPYQANQLLERNDPSRPLVYLSYALIYRFAKLDPVPYHLFNLLLHFGCALLVMLLVRTVARRLGAGEGTLPGLAAGLFFAVTPIQTGTVIYAYGLSDVLSGFLVLLSLYLWARRPEPGRTAVALSCAAFALSLFAKQSSFVLPFLVVLYDFAFVGGLRLSPLKGRVKYYAVYFALFALYIVYRYATFHALGDIEGRGNTHPAGAYFFSQPAVIVKYLLLTLVPYNLAIDHYLVPGMLSTARKAVSLVLLLSLAAPLAWCVRRPGPAARLVFFSILFYLVCLAPTSSFLPTVDIMVERRAYLANAGLFLLLVLLYDARGGGLSFLSGRLGKAALAAAAVHVALLAFVAAGRNKLFASEKSVWQDVLRIHPGSERATNNLANLFLEGKDYAQAKAMFESLIARNPRDWIALHNLGSIYTKEGSPFYDQAAGIELFRKSVTANPDYASGWYNLGREYQKGGMAAEAEEAYRKTLKLDPNHVLAHNNLGLLAYHQGKMQEARALYEEGLALDPDCGPCKFNLALLDKGPPATFTPPQGTMQPMPPQGAAPQPPDGQPPQGAPGGGGPQFVPLDQVPPDILIQLYEQALARDPGNAEFNKKLDELTQKKQRGQAPQ